MVKRILLTMLLLALAVAGALTIAGAQEEEKAMPTPPVPEMNPEGSLVVLWTSKHPEVAEHMILPYVSNSKRLGWWKDVTLIVWGPSAPLVAEHEELEAALRRMKEAGVVLEACRVCSDRYGVSDELTQMGIDVKYMGEVLTGYLKEGRTVLTF